MCCNKKDMPTLSISDNGSEISHKFNFVDPTIEDWFEAFRGLLVGITYSEDQFNQFILDYANSLTESKEVPITITHSK